MLNNCFNFNLAVSRKLEMAKRENYSEAREIEQFKRDICTSLEKITSAFSFNKTKYLSAITSFENFIKDEVSSKSPEDQSLGNPRIILEECCHPSNRTEALPQTQIDTLVNSLNANYLIENIPPFANFMVLGIFLLLMGGLIYLIYSCKQQRNSLFFEPKKTPSSSEDNDEKEPLNTKISPC